MPAKFRDLINEQAAGKLVLTVDKSRCLVVYPLPAWEDVEQKLYSVSSTKESVQRYLRYLLQNAEECEMDSQGRFVVPPRLREYAGLSKQVVLAGYLKKLELWDEDRYMASQDQFQWPSDDELPDEIASLTL
jgi:MraZ protein